MRVRLATCVTIAFAVLSFGMVQSSNATTTTSAAFLLGKLKVSGEHPNGYNRDYFKLWVDANHDGCNTREEVLLAEATKRPTANSNCTIYGGSWKSVYDNITFTSARSLDIDHMVPLSEAWQSGAYRWDADTRERYANDLGYSRSLIAVSATTNRAKGDKDPYLWMPPSHSYWCQYVGDWIAIKYRWGLTIDSAEKRDLQTKVRSCGARTHTIKPALAVRHFSSGTDTSGTGSTSGDTSGSSSNGSNSKTDPHYSSCKQAKAAGYGPYYRGRDTEYPWYRDGDGDGIACE